MTDIYQAILADHKRHRELLDKIADTSGDSEQRRKFWDDFYYDVSAHAAAEEETFYSKLLEEPHGQDKARHSVHEHQEMDDIMIELSEMDFSSPGWLARFKTLKHDYEHHMEEEENEIFNAAKKLFSDTEETEFAENFAKRKAAEFKLVDEKAKEKMEE